MPTIQEQVDLIIANAIDSAYEAQSTAQDKVDAATEAAGLLVVPADPGNLSSYSEVTVTPPVLDYGNIFDTTEHDRREEILEKIEGEWDAFLNKYFPLTLSTAQLNWLEDSILNGGTGIPVNVEDAIYQRGRDRITEEADAAIDEATDGFSRFGWVMPPGALTKRIDAVEEQKRKKLCEFNRDVAINQAELEQKNIQFAVDQATRLQQGVWDAAARFINALLGAYNPANDTAKGLTDATIQFYEQTLEYYKTLLLAGQDKRDHEKTDIDIDLQVANLAREILDNRAARLTEAALGGARVMGDLAASSLAGQNTMASLVVEATGE